MIGIDFTSDVDYQCEDFSIYGLDNPVAILTIDYTESVDIESESETSEETEESEESDSGTITETVEVLMQTVLYIGGQSESGAYYVRLDGSKEIHTIGSGTVNALIAAGQVSLMSDSIVSGTLSSAVGITIAVDGIEWELTKISSSEDDEDESVEQWYLGDAEIELTELTAAYSKLSSMQAEKILSEASEATGAESICVTIAWETGTDTVISFTEYDSSYQLATVDGLGWKLANKKDVESFISAVEELLG